MIVERRRDKRQDLVSVMFFLAVIAIPFDDFNTLLPLGELKTELSALFFLPLTVLVAVRQFLTNRTSRRIGVPVSRTDLLPQLAFLLLSIVIISGLVNMQQLLGPALNGRLPLEKFLVSTMVMIYGLGIAYVTYHVLDQASWTDMVARPICISVVLSSIFVVFELLAASGGFPASVYRALSTVVHSGASVNGLTPDALAHPSDWGGTGRARSLCFEPPALAAFAGAAWPWCHAAATVAERRQKVWYWSIFGLCNALLMLAVARTSVVLLIGNVMVLLLLRFVYLAPRPRSFTVKAVASTIILVSGISFLAFCALNLDRATAIVAHDDAYVSNISRLSMILAAIQMGYSHPFWGYGFGQFGFHYFNFLPAWAYESWEVRDWIAGVYGWPPVFSTIARFAGEIGLVGVVVWCGLWLMLVHLVWSVTERYQRQTGRLPALSYSAIMSCFCTLFSGLAADTLRTPFIWITMGVCCCYISEVKRQLAQAPAGRLSPPIPLKENTLAIASIH